MKPILKQPPNTGVFASFVKNADIRYQDSCVNVKENNMKIRIRRVITERLSEAFFRYAAKGWFICNAPRPIYGTETWQGNFVSGVFYAAIDPTDTQAAWMLQRNIELQADFLAEASDQLMRDWVKAHCARNDYDFSEIEEDTGIIIDTYFNYQAVREITINSVEQLLAVNAVIANLWVS
jgi:hypothetical protein